MRSAKRSKAPKKSYRNEKINKKRHKKSKRSWGWNDDLSGLFIDDINEAIRTRKARRTEGKSCWKLVPKDSCEIYKDRKKRSGSTRKRSNFSSEEISNDETRMEEDKKDKKRLRKKKVKGNLQRSQPKKKRRARAVSYYTSQSTLVTNRSTTSSSSYYSDKSSVCSCHCYD